MLGVLQTRCYTSPQRLPGLSAAKWLLQNGNNINNSSSSSSRSSHPFSPYGFSASTRAIATLRNRLRGHIFPLFPRTLNLSFHRTHSRPRNPPFREPLRSYGASAAAPAKRSPYAVLGLRGAALPLAPETIKAAFRQKAKIYHPDLNPHNRPPGECEALMSELVEACERLLHRTGGGGGDDDEFLDRLRAGGSQRVALACELCSVDELLRDGVHEVHPLRLVLEDSDGTHEGPREGGSDRWEDSDLPASPASVAVPVTAHPQDSVSDLKGRLSSEFGTAWGLQDGDTGWELVAVRKTKNDPESTPKPPRGSTEEKVRAAKEETRPQDEDPTTVAANNVILSYHLFLDDYHLRHGDVIYAVVRRNDHA